MIYIWYQFVHESVQMVPISYMNLEVFVKRKQNSYIGAYKRGAAAGGRRRPPFIGATARGRRSYIGVLLSLYKILNITFDL